jgi:hypothetical protein
VKKKILVVLTLAFAFHSNAYYTTATHFTCESSDRLKNLLLMAPSLSNSPGVEELSFSDGVFHYTGTSITIDHRAVRVFAFGTVPDASAVISFMLPEDLLVEHRRAGTYFPIHNPQPSFRTIPIEFSMTVSIFSSDNLLTEHLLACTGK